ncbi:DUF3747 domain-containing protein [Acaryochloris sp. IP29b_bin.137]|uniref:DUF3747 domain-containing protein n=1 Tax=Acaryochloris sp. IP29b_bin.137 TaxID=2969217 RepID=UPI002628FAE3|nr:DUF3747 domain-containing protein [Acaryochloris sp. IP29b_bin.137]
MKYHLSRGTVAIASLFLSLILSPSAQAYTFDQVEVDQHKFIAIAVPFAAGKHYNLIILEQISSARACWEEQAGGVIDPLLLQFDFSGICGRSTDSNGYSIRQAGQDYALDYRLSVVKQSGNLVLMGYPSRNPRAPKLKIGQTQGVTDGFLKIELEPGWRFAKRSYNGKTLGHIYFTRDQVPNTRAETIAEAPSDAVPAFEAEDVPPAKELDRLPPLEPLPSQAPASTDPAHAVPKSKGKVDQSQERDELTNLITSPIEIPVPNPVQPLRSAPPVPPSHARKTPGVIALPRPETNSELPELTGESPPPVTSPQSSRYRPSSKRSSKRRKLLRLAAKPPLPSGAFSQPIPIPVPPPRRAAVASIPRALPSLPGPRPSFPPGNILPVPQSNAPLGRYRPASDIYSASRDASRARQLAAIAGTGNPPPPPLDERSRLRYRVVVKAANSADYKRIKTLVPDAFRSRYKGRSVLQVGAYEKRIEADERLNMLSLEGIDGILDIR